MDKNVDVLFEWQKQKYHHVLDSVMVQYVIMVKSL